MDVLRLRAAPAFSNASRNSRSITRRAQSASILASFCDAIIAAACRDNSEALRVVELGAGTASKTTILLDAAARLQSEVLYAPVDVSSDALDVACETIATSLPEVCISPIVANYVTHPPQLESFNGTTLGLYIGSSIGNFTPEEARTILRNLRGQLQAGDALLLGVDMVKDEPTLVAAYDDRDGVTAEFNLNMLHRLNRELDADFDLARFRHRALWNPAESRIEMHLESTRDQHVRIAAANLDVCFAKGERIHTENSYKFTARGSAFFSARRVLRSSRRGQTSAGGIPLRSCAFGEKLRSAFRSSPKS